jgi:type II secretory pathway pseudopilin PulG
MNRELRNNQGFALIGSLMIMLVFTILISVSMIRSDMQLKQANQRRAVHEAFYSAESGIDKAIAELRRNADWDPIDAASDSDPNNSFAELKDDDNKIIGYYRVDVEDGGVLNGWNTRWIKSIGRDSLNDMTRVIVARVFIENPTRFLISTLGELHIGSGASINADVLGWDIYFDVNTSLGSPGMNIIMNGDVFYISSINGETQQGVQFGSSSQIQQTPSITFAGVDLNRFRSLAQELQMRGEGIYDNGDLRVNLDSVTNPGPGQPVPKIIFAEGNIDISGNYANSLIVVAGENIYINGSIEASHASSLPFRPQLGLLAKQDVIISTNVQTSGGDLNLEAFVMADGGGSTQGEFLAQGAAGSLGTLNFLGSIAVRGQGRTGVNMNAFRTRNYIFNSELNTNRSIPFNPFIVNLLEWHEAKDNDPFPPATAP